MKLLFALPGFHRYDRGAEVALLSIASELARSGDEVMVVGSGFARPASYSFRRVPAVRRETFERFPKFPPFRSETAWEDATFAAGLLREPSLEGFDATITCSYPFTHWALRRAGRSGPAHIFVTQNGDWPAYSDSSEYRLFHCDGLVCTNPDYLARNQARWRTTLIPNGVNLDTFARGVPSRQRFGLPEDGPIILMVSAFIPSKRVLEGIRAVAALEGAFLVVAGDGPLRDEARILAQNILPGRYAQLSLTSDEMPSLYHSADVFLHMSLLESFGNVFLEAWASGLPIVGHDTARLRWILGDEHLLCDTERCNVVTEALRQAIIRGRTPPSSNLDQFSWSSIAERYREFIRSVLDAR